MKKNALFLILLFCSLSSFSQIHKITIYAFIINGPVDYYDAEKLLPDSIANTILINYRKKYHLKSISGNAVLYRMNLDGWKVIGIRNETGLFYLSKEITLDEAAYKYYLEKLNAFEAK